MNFSRRSLLLLLGSTLAPISIGIASFQYRQAQYEARAGGGDFLDFYPARIFPAMIVAGIACFAGALISLVFDYLRSRKVK
jgi:hypothetical protein